MKKYGIVGAAVALITGFAFYMGLTPFDYKPSLGKVLVEGVIYNIGVAVVEELYVRGLLLNLIEKLCGKRKNSTLVAIVISSAVFGIGHIFGVSDQPLIVIIAKVVWTIAMGIYFGAIYKKTDNLMLPIILHLVTNICALPYCFTTKQGYADVSLYIIVPAYLALAAYSFFILKMDNKKLGE